MYCTATVQSLCNSCALGFELFNQFFVILHTNVMLEIVICLWVFSSWGLQTKMGKTCTHDDLSVHKSMFEIVGGWCSISLRL